MKFNKEMIYREIRNMVPGIYELRILSTAAKNPSRILKLPGTLAMKGRDTEERPHRMSYIIRDPGPIGTEASGYGK